MNINEHIEGRTDAHKGLGPNDRQGYHGHPWTFGQ